ncbi:PREDICTED: uncharacterized protein LOC109356803 [Lupinus angustifolius]|uniref:uncharacterized protein LOC109356803 n=1 Tax=Lupinus angustifolius TaxID=3871 RepID=UPI00092EEFEC|nr:PREDICTED: uncharacterized protein LOC109356803 [Lupinus angustifolius]
MEEWCSHCCRFIKIILEPCSEPGYFVSSCTLCGKLLSDIFDAVPLQMIIATKKKRFKTHSRRLKRVRKFKHDVKLDKTDSESVCVDPIVKEEKKPINSDTVQTSDNH